MRRWEWLAGLALKNKWRYGAELGVKEGHTLFFLLEHCPKLHMIGVDSWDFQPEKGIDYAYNNYNHKENERIVREKAKQYDVRITLLKMLTTEAAKQIENQSLDFVFIDADHSTKGVIADIQAWRPKIKPGGLLCGHDANKESVRIALDEILKGWVKLPFDSCWSES
jgi:predicted O-methyltransferase YrrM